MTDREKAIVMAYAKQETAPWKCHNCGTIGEAIISKYNGHKHFHCKVCGCSFME